LAKHFRQEMVIQQVDLKQQKKFKKRKERKLILILVLVTKI